jgi:hypothetical protein
MSGYDEMDIFKLREQQRLKEERQILAKRAQIKAEKQARKWNSEPKTPYEPPPEILPPVVVESIRTDNTFRHFIKLVKTVVKIGGHVEETCQYSPTITMEGEMDANFGSKINDLIGMETKEFDADLCKNVNEKFPVIYKLIKSIINEKNEKITYLQSNKETAPYKLYKKQRIGIAGEKVNQLVHLYTTNDVRRVVIIWIIASASEDEDEDEDEDENNAIQYLDKSELTKYGITSTMPSKGGVKTRRRHRRRLRRIRSKKAKTRRR